MPSSGVWVRASTQLNKSEQATTTNNGLTISATADAANCNGRNEHIAISVAPSKFHFGRDAPSVNAVAGFTPRAIERRALSTTTIALSTNIPIAMINPANEVRFNPSPTTSIINIVPPMASNNDEPITTP